MTAYGHFPIGTGMRCWIQCRIEGTLVDPSGLAYHVTDPTDTRADYTYGTDVELVKDSTGAYHIDVYTDQAGSDPWRYRWDSTNGMVKQDQFYIDDSNQA